MHIETSIQDPAVSVDGCPPQQVVTKATVEARPPWVHPDMHVTFPSAMPPASLQLDFETFKPDTCQPSVHGDHRRATFYTSEGDSTYASTSTGERLFTPREVKHVTFDLYSSQDDWAVNREIIPEGLRKGDADEEDSGDSMYNSGESFPPPPCSEELPAYGAYCCQRRSPPPCPQSDSEEDDETSGGGTSDSGGEDKNQFQTALVAPGIGVSESPRTKCSVSIGSMTENSRPPPMESSL